MLRKTLRSPYHINPLNKDAKKITYMSLCYSSLNFHLMSFNTSIYFYKIYNTALRLVYMWSGAQPNSFMELFHEF